MVGVPRSKGCRICVQRRVRCDLTRPTCSNCKKGNRPCPGYDSDLKFQDEGERLRKRLAKKEQKRPAKVPAASVPDSLTSSCSTVSEPWSNKNSPDSDPTDISKALTPRRKTFFAFLESQKTFQPLDLEDVSRQSLTYGDDGEVIDSR